MMKRIFLPIAAITLAFVLLAPYEALTNSKGAPAAHTGGPGDDPVSCSDSGCHEGAEDNSGGGAITITTPAQFAPGETIDVTIRVEQAGAMRFGFQATIRDANTLASTGNIQAVDGTEFSDAIREFITHSDAVEAADAAEWTFQWTAPAEDATDIIIYASGVAGNGNGRKSGDNVYTTNLSTPVGVAVEDERPPSAFDLQPAYPNPFDRHTTITYSLQHPEPVKFALYDALGRLVRSTNEGHLPAGAHEILVDAASLPAGTYYYEIQTPTSRQTQPIVKIQ